MRRARRRIFGVLAAALAIAGALWYLRDPGWLGEISSGLRPWERDADGTRVRWSGGHASFFVPSAAGTVTIPIRTTFASADAPIRVNVNIDDRPAERVTLTDDGWRTIVLRLPPSQGRRWRRVDLRTDRTRPGNRGVEVGEVR